MKRRHVSLFVGTSLTLAGPCWASDDAMQPAQEEATSEEETGLRDIVVTATRRDERLQDVPISVTAVDGEMLAKSGIANTRELTYTIPALNFRITNANAQPTIRGVGTRNTGGGDESNIAVYVDGVYQVSPRAGIFDLLNIERVEVLRGPQGTLFGRNATGGLVNIITSKPSHDPEARIVARYGRFDERSAAIYATTGVADGLAVDFAGQIYRDDGYHRDLVSGDIVYPRKSYSARGRALIEPSADTSFTLTGSFFHWNDPVSAYMGVYQGNTVARSLANDPRTIVPTEPFTTASTFKQRLRLESLSLSHEARIDLGAVTLQNTTSYEDSKSDAVLENDGTPFDLGIIINLGLDEGGDGRRFSSKYFQNELRLLSNGGGPFSYILGVHYLNGRAENGPVEQAPRVNSPVAARTFIDSNQRTDAIAGFGEANWLFSPGWRATVGVRYTSETKKFDGVTTRGGVVLTSISGAKRTFGKLTYRAILQRDIGDIGNVYVSYSRGFKSGVFNIFSTSATSRATRPEVLDAYEAGIKTDPLPWLRVNASLYHYDYQDIQLSSRDPGSGLTVLFNAANAKVDGGELEVTAEPLDNLNLRGNVAYSDGKYTDFPGAQIFTPIFQDQSAIGGSPMTPIGNRVSIADVSGSRLIRAPKVTFGAFSTIRSPRLPAISGLPPICSEARNISGTSTIAFSSRATRC